MDNKEKTITQLEDETYKSVLNAIQYKVDSINDADEIERMGKLLIELTESRYKTTNYCIVHGEAKDIDKLNGLINVTDN